MKNQTIMKSIYCIFATYFAMILSTVCINPQNFKVPPGEKNKLQTHATKNVAELFLHFTVKTMAIYESSEKSCHTFHWPGL